MDFESMLRAATADGPFEGKSVTVRCRVASVVWKDAQERFERISTLIYILLVLALLAILAAVALFVFGDDAVGTALVTLVSGLISGGLAGFIKEERDKAEVARDAAIAIINDSCGDQEPDQVLASIGV
jgi:hypothetical protein